MLASPSWMVLLVATVALAPSAVVLVRAAVLGPAPSPRAVLAWPVVLRRPLLAPLNRLWPPVVLA